MAANHPLASRESGASRAWGWRLTGRVSQAHLVLPACKRFPTQSAALFQATVDLHLGEYRPAALQAYPSADTAEHRQRNNGKTSKWSSWTNALAPSSKAGHLKPAQT